MIVVLEGRGALRQGDAYTPIDPGRRSLLEGPSRGR